MKYDLIIVGGGPGGLMSAKTAAEAGLKVLLIERKRDITEIKRLCSQFAPISMLSVGGKVKYGYTESFNLEIGTEKTMVHFPELGISIDYNGPLRPYLNYIYFSPSGHRVYREKERFFGFFWEKESLLASLLASAEKTGAEIITGTIAIGIENTSNGVKVAVYGKHGNQTFEARKAIAADGAGSQLVHMLGLLKGSECFGAPVRGVGFVLERVETELRLNSWLSCTIPSLNAMNILLSMLADDRSLLSTVGTGGRSPSEVIEKFMKLPYFKPWFRRARIINKMAVHKSTRHNPIQEPVAGNVLVLGEAAGVGDSTIPGAIACGYQAAKAVLKELEGERGYRDYVAWWPKSLEGIHTDYRKAAGRFFSLNLLCTNAEVDYLYKVLEGQVGVPAVLVAQNIERIKFERPKLYEKLIKTGMERDINGIKLDFAHILEKNQSV